MLSPDFTNGCKPDDHHPQAQMKQIFQEGKLKTGDKKTIKEFSQKYIVSEKLVADYIGNPTHNEMRKDKCPTDNDRKHAQKKQQEYKDIEWEDLYHRNQLPSPLCRTQIQSLTVTVTG